MAPTVDDFNDVHCARAAEASDVLDQQLEVLAPVVVWVFLEVDPALFSVVCPMLDLLNQIWMSDPGTTNKPNDKFDQGNK